MLKFLDNRAAAVLAAASLGCLIPGLMLPCIVFTGLDGVRSYSLPESIAALLREGQYLVGGTLFAFSICFPLVKLMAILAASSRLTPLSPEMRRAVRKIVAATGKYSMLDVFVLAVLVVAVKLEGMIEARLLPGTVFFLVSIVLSMLAAQGVRPEPRPLGNAAAKEVLPLADDRDAEKTAPPAPALPDGATSTRGPDKSLPASLQTPALPVAEIEATRLSRAPRMAKGLALLVLFLAGCVAASLGGRMLLAPADLAVDTLELTKGMEIIPSVGEFFDTPDYFLRMTLADGSEVDTESFEDKLIGNGIVWNVALTPLDQIQEITVMDDNDVVSDDALDRVTVRGLVNQGQLYTITLSGPPPESRTGAVWLTAVGGAVALLLMLRFLVRQAL